MPSTTTEHTCETCGGTEFTVSINRSESWTLGHLSTYLMVFYASPTCEKRHEPDMVQVAKGDTLS